MTSHLLRAKTLHRAFEIAIWIKGIDGVLEIIGGILLLITNNVALNRLVIALTQHELSEDPQDWIATTARQAVSQLSADTRVLGSIYLLAHGLVKLMLVVGLRRRQRWAYPVTISFLCLFISYQLYRLSAHYSLGLLLLTVFDIGMVDLAWREYRVQTA
jgi:uncharacterized membrane protein